MAKNIEIQCRVNGKSVSGSCEPRTLLADFLRDHLDLTGTHVGCEHGACGVCSIIVNGNAVRSCIMLAVQANDADITTIEGIAKAGKFHVVQKMFHENHALQCGFCTPGMLAVIIDFLSVNPSPTEAEAREAISAVICRCTGYQNIVKAVMSAAKELRNENAAANEGALAHA